MNVLSLFDGISCGLVALKRLGFNVENYYASEIDNNAIQISENNHPEIIRLGDIKDIDAEFIKSLPKIDLVLAGSPCQGFSRSGKGLNFEDPRSKLFFNFMTILKLVKRHNNPNPFFLLENVKMKNEWRDVITDYIGVEPIQINSKVVSAQNRTRLYWTNIPDVQQPVDKGVVLNDILQEVELGEYVNKGKVSICKSFSENSRNLVDYQDSEIRVRQSTLKGYKVANPGDGINISFPTSKSRRGRVIDNKSSTMDCACNIGVLDGDLIRRFTINELERLQTLPDDYTLGVSDTARKKALGNGWTVDVITHILKGIEG